MKRAPWPGLFSCEETDVAEDGMMVRRERGTFGAQYVYRVNGERAFHEDVVDGLTFSFRGKAVESGEILVRGPFPTRTESACEQAREFGGRSVEIAHEDDGCSFRQPFDEADEFSQSVLSRPGALMVEMGVQDDKPSRAVMDFDAGVDARKGRIRLDETVLPAGDGSVMSCGRGFHGVVLSHEQRVRFASLFPGLSEIPMIRKTNSQSGSHRGRDLLEADNVGVHREERSFDQGKPVWETSFTRIHVDADVEGGYAHGCHPLTNDLSQATRLFQNTQTGHTMQAIFQWKSKTLNEYVWSDIIVIEYHGRE